MDVDTKISNEDVISSAHRTLRIEAKAIEEISYKLNNEFIQSVKMLFSCKGRVVISGIGKTGHIGRKIAATLASTGTPAFFVHAAEAMHGDLGMLTRNDVLIAISYSGSGPELLSILPTAKRLGVKIIAITGNIKSKIANLSDSILDINVKQEACPLNLAPTASTTAALALGDALAVACLELRCFNLNDFARSHPGGTLGRNLLTLVQDVMRPPKLLPIVHPRLSVLEALDIITSKNMGMAIIMGENKIPLGIFTDGDLRRLLMKHKEDICTISILNGMSSEPFYISPKALAIEAAKKMDEKQINQLIVLDEHNTLIGALHVHDLMNAKII
ncbi:arabinose-5-phosphate isomerase [Candidatus Kinetoplastibacterium blastocrithidii TCC012E]|uniref:Arabinose-5-phosphate isomerase n=1 Tax=Candidatus Kinetoplastidibacterium blastocrithidiae TCC012E TaxID=1208922 RepID=M1M1C0_9PROT|nr:KpsF/GutQ family sugar-phosphate isomerase [Candidatus Kinetoplastibacterium blastocrithidii]AFZ83256.1 arabinose-5-phosphate isomerase [Candidatus Kinetoplastibacterium blastocrithidii (ex Strigomonas culicis)]AGF50071.1 arabinose-5-phosphate isomerase [Candidatus Kinetoplastibacterium blastocrithidii TCC012E]